jgi:hypothetical protein
VTYASAMARRAKRFDVLEVARGNYAPDAYVLIGDVRRQGRGWGKTAHRRNPDSRGRSICWLDLGDRAATTGPFKGNVYLCPKCEGSIVPRRGQERSAGANPDDAERRELAASWVVLAKSVRTALGRLDVDHVDLSTFVDDCDRKAALDIRICRVVDGYPWLVADLVVVGPALAARCAEAGWHQWRRSSDFRWRRQVPPPRLPDVQPGELVVCARRERAPGDVVREVFSLLTKQLSIRDPKHVSLTVTPCSAAEAQRRRRELGVLQPKAATHRTAGPRRLPVSTCSGCGQPLSDPVSVAIGMGPECRKRYRPELVRKVQKYPEVDRWLWVGAIPVSEWRTRIRARLNVPPQYRR